MRPYLLPALAGLLALSSARAQSNPAFMDPSMPGDDAQFMFTLVNGGSGIPANGVLLLQGPYDKEPTVVVRDIEASVVLEGTAEPIEDSAFWVWRSDEPLPAGTRCELEITSATAQFESNWIEFRVEPQVDLEQPVIETSPSASVIKVVGEKACCRTQFTVGAGLEETSQCFTVGYESTVHVEPGALSRSGQAASNQYLFRFITEPGARPVYSTGSFVGLVLPVYRDQADEYCFEVEALELPTGRELTYDDLDTCADHGALPDLGLTEVDPIGPELRRAICPAPPDGYEELWCEINDDCKDEEIAECQLYPHICEGEPLKTFPDAGRPTSSGDGDGDGDDEPAGVGGSDGGCAATGRSAGQGQGGVAALVALALLVRRRRPIAPRCAKPR